MGPPLVGAIGFHRAQLLDLLASYLDTKSVTTHFSKRLATYTQPLGSPVQLTFTDSSTATADVLIGCDGIKSAVRRTMLSVAASRLEATGVAEDQALASRLRDSIEPVWSGWAAYRGVVPREMVESVYPNTRALSLPINVSYNAYHNST